VPGEDEPGQHVQFEVGELSSVAGVRGCRRDCTTASANSTPRCSSLMKTLRPEKDPFRSAGSLSKRPHTSLSCTDHGPHAQEQLHRHAGQPETQRLLRTAEYQVMIPSPLLNRRSSAEKRGLRHERPSILAVERRRREIAM
jgi:hypothetical protein